MSVIFCTTCKGRLQHVQQTLPVNLANNRSNDSKCLVLDYNSQDNLIPWLKANFAAEIERGKLIVYSYREPGPFKMAHAKNVAHRLGILEGGTILVNMDADNFTGPDCDRYIAKQLPSSDMFLCARMVKSGPGKLARGIAGRIAVSATAFLLAGGYNEKYNTWAPEDLDFNVRLRRMGFIARESDAQHLGGIPHTDRLRFREYPHARGYLNGEEDRLVYASKDTVVNYGNFGCAAVYRNFGETPLELKPLPTRIFGIGMHKTATTSLHAAMQILGYDSAHWPRGDWVRDLWDEMLAFGRSKTLERHYAISDNPIPILYRELDAAYPNSKFILTVRKESAWLASVKRHWNYDSNPTRWEWDKWPIANRVHRALYGRTDFHAETFAARYLQHNAGVLEHFKERPNDLLVMDMDAGAGWPELCRFLNRPVPCEPYPKRYVNS